MQCSNSHNTKYHFHARQHTKKCHISTNKASECNLIPRSFCFAYFLCCCSFTTFRLDLMESSPCVRDTYVRLCICNVCVSLWRSEQIAETRATWRDREREKNWYEYRAKKVHRYVSFVSCACSWWYWNWGKGHKILLRRNSIKATKTVVAVFVFYRILPFAYTIQHPK